jgi:hypothetical protein
MKDSKTKRVKDSNSNYVLTVGMQVLPKARDTSVRLGSLAWYFDEIPIRA